MIEIFQITDINLWQLFFVCFIAFMLSILSGMSGYGAGLIMPVFLMPIVGISNIIPIMAVTMLLNTGFRAMAFWSGIQWNHVCYMLLFGLPACIAGAYCYTLLNSYWIALLLGIFLLISIPIRRVMNQRNFRLSPNSERITGIAFGFINGGMAGTGIILISILMSAGLHSVALIATDAIISATLAIIKIAIFGSTAKLNFDLAIVGVLIGICMAPGGFIARQLLNFIPIKIHTWVMEVVIFSGGIMFILHAI